VVVGCGRSASAPAALAPSASVRPAQRIVSLAPSITEILYALDLGARVVGVTSYCDYPPEAATKPKVGALLDPNIEAVLSLRPDLVILFATHGAALSALQALELPCLTVSGDTMEQILTSIQTIATACGCAERGTELTAALRRRVDAVARKPRSARLPRVLVSVGRSMGSGRLQEVYVAGEDGFFSELIRLAGGCNACPERTIRFPLVSPEGIQEMNPDVIIELAADLDRLSLTAADVVREWNVVREVSAVRQGRVHVFAEDYVTVPGPRFVLLLEQMAAVIAPAPSGQGTAGGTP
jgi:iron complex transport system substrate-binding protein